MKLLFQFGVIAIFTFIGEILNYVLPFPIPASIYGLVLLFIALCTKIVKLEQVETAAEFFLAIMPIMFVPPTVNLMTVWPVLKDNLFALLLVCIVSTVVVMGLTGRIAQSIINLQNKKSKEHRHE